MVVKILIFGLVVAFAEILGGLLIVYRRSWPRRAQEILLALGAGFILALVFIKLIPASIEAIGESSAIFVLIGFAAIHFFEHTLVEHLHFGEETHADVMVSRTASISAFVGLLIHAFFDGFSISIGLQFDAMIGVLIFLAVLLHKFPEGLTIGSIMMAAGHHRKTIVLGTLGIGGATMLGTIVALTMGTVDKSILGGAFAFSAGAAAYVGASDLIPEINKSKDRIPPLIVFLGMVLFYLSEMLLEGML
ncbi:MAG: ZIP family magnesium transporter [Ignavibacteria bacterium]|nr:ZIP family magnesium transporter [Ignavibacteria bacterium]